jgi:NAD(P) transhydrogenase subunit alpha
MTGERRVALTPDVVRKLARTGFRILIEHGAGEGASFLDSMYEGAGAEIVPVAAALYGASSIVV